MARGTATRSSLAVDFHPDTGVNIDDLGANIGLSVTSSPRAANGPRTTLVQAWAHHTGQEIWIGGLDEAERDELGFIRLSGRTLILLAVNEDPPSE